jgi:hypothetical protein
MLMLSVLAAIGTAACGFARGLAPDLVLVGNLLQVFQDLPRLWLLHRQVA